MAVKVEVHWLTCTYNYRHNYKNLSQLCSTTDLGFLLKTPGLMVFKRQASIISILIRNNHHHDPTLTQLTVKHLRTVGCIQYCTSTIRHRTNHAGPTLKFLTVTTDSVSIARPPKVQHSSLQSLVPCLQ